MWLVKFLLTGLTAWVGILLAHLPRIKNIKYIRGCWCNGSTVVCDTISVGSTPTLPPIWRDSLMGKEHHHQRWRREFDTRLASIKFVWGVAEKSEESTMTAWKVTLTPRKDEAYMRRVSQEVKIRGFQSRDAGFNSRTRHHYLNCYG